MKKNIRNKLIKMLILSFILIYPAYGKLESMADVTNFKGLDVHLSDYGASFGGFYQWSFQKFQLSLYGGWTSVTGGKEYTYTDYYGFQHVLNEVSLNFFKAGTIVKHHVFKGKIANSFSPFVSIQAGAVLALDTPEYVSFTEKVNNISYVPGYYGGLYIGADFMVNSRMALSLAAGKEANFFAKTIDHYSVWSGSSVVLQYGYFF